MEKNEAFIKLISLYNICDYLQDINEEKTAEELRQALNDLSDFVYLLKD